MEKTTMYLTEELQRDLKALAKRTGRPQADLIREALGEYIERSRTSKLPSWVGIAAVGGDASTVKQELRPQYLEHLDRKYGRTKR
jgi:predicted transcriptional regulator